MSEKQPYNNFSFKYRPFIYVLYETISAISPFKQPKHTLELKLSNFNNFASVKVFIYLPAACLTTTIDQSPKLLGISLHNFPV